MALIRPIGSARPRTGAETAFGILRTLLRAELLWADSGALSVEALGMLAGVTPVVLRRALIQLIADGVIEFSADPNRIRLSESTWRDLRHLRQHH